MSDLTIEIGTVVSIQKTELDNLITQLAKMGYEVIGPKARDHTIIHAPMKSAAELPLGYNSRQEPGKYWLEKNGHQNYFDYVNGSQGWKPYFFPPKMEMMKFHQQDQSKNEWELGKIERQTPHYALIGVRPCDLAAIEVQDKVFMRDAFCDQVYQSRREKAFIMAVNCTQTAGTCFCVSMGTGPKARGGFDLCLTELENVFLVEIGSEAGRMLLTSEGVTWSPASAFLLNSATRALETAEQNMARQIPDPENLKRELMADLNSPEWEAVAARCLSCTSCTQVCPTCFCWESTDHTQLPSDTVVRVRQWDSCFNPDYSYVAHGNTRPSTRARYRQWLTHKFASWHDQFGGSGCVGCGRCITWCTAGIDHVEEIEKLRAGGQP
jgi:formate hydrogenlyase subunit 6/NADH:ubiquinone oxidoreductase subunit I